MAQSLCYELRCKVLDGLTNGSTIKQYKDDIERFATYAKTQKDAEHPRGILHMRDLPTLEDRQRLVQSYVHHLAAEGKAPATIHTRIAPICKGLDIPASKGRGWEGIEKPPRRAAAVSKGRIPDLCNPQGLQERTDPSKARSVHLAEITGLRRDELRRLSAGSLKVDCCGKPCVEIKGKGGKVQHQRISAEDVPRLRALIGDKVGGMRILEHGEMGRHIDYHAIRRERAQEMYEKYCAAIKRGEGPQLISELVRTWDAYHPMNRPSDQRHRAEFIKELTGSPYKLRGDSVTRASVEGRPTVYDRLALMCVSVWHLAHWRVDVTVTHYML